MNARPQSTLLPSWGSVLAVVAHPDDESFGLGAIIDSFIATGARVSVLCLTHGEASSLHGVEGELRDLREGELRDAAQVLGITNVRLASYPDGALATIALEDLVGDVVAAAIACGAVGLIAFDISGVTGHPDHIRATEAAVAAGATSGLGVLGWTLPVEVAGRLAEEFGAPFVGHDNGEIDIAVEVSRTLQMRAVACHPSQAVPGSVLWRRLELLGDLEHLRWMSSLRA